MKLIFNIWLILCLALSANYIGVRTHAKSRSTTRQPQGWNYFAWFLVGEAKASSGAVITGLDGNVWSDALFGFKAR